MLIRVIRGEFLVLTLRNPREPLSVAKEGKNAKILAVISKMRPKVERGHTVELDDLADEVVQLLGGTFYARRASYGIMMLA